MRKFEIYGRWCKKKVNGKVCGRYFKADSKFSTICPKCKVANGSWWRDRNLKPQERINKLEQEIPIQCRSR